jgi:phosphatidylserine/phosphatidylglycerophosphate/cardiolipin synthase-like enzyme/uncharacterized membrane protein YdjX (TVP38/TMEM64 family)
MTPEPLAKSPLLRPGDTCWRLEQASRLQFLIDGSEYFAALRSALLRARHSILILGWDIDSRMTLQADAPDDDLPAPFGAFLNEVVRRQPRLHANVLSWDYAVLFALEREWLPRLAWRTHRRLHFRLDKHHPTGASHHQKVVVIDDRVAFVGGLDITRCRWDTPEHKPDDARRVDADGKPYGPFHDVQMIVEGPVAGALGELARERWRRATGKRLRSSAPALARAPAVAPESPWPPELQSALENVEVGVLRTEPAFAGAPPVSEVQRFYYSAIAAARSAIFLENQYFSSTALADRLAARLAEPEGPEVVIITPHRESGWLEETTMGVLRARLYRTLKGCDPQQRFRPYCPVFATDAGQCLNVHSKVMTIDDELLTVGSANLSNRSMHLDTECNLALEAATQGEQAAAVRATIAGLRNRLLAEHLDVAIATVAAATRSDGLTGAIEALRTGTRTLAPAQIEQRPDIDTSLADAALVDPMQPLETDYLIEQYLPHEQRRSARGHATLIGLAVLLFGGLALAWQQTPLHEYLDLESALRFAEQLQSQPLAPLWVLLTYVVAGIAVVPVVLLIAVTAMVFGPGLGVLYALGGSLLSATAMYCIGALLGQDTLQRFLKGRLRRLNKQLEQRGVLAVAVIRLMPVAPFTIVNLLAGAARIQLWQFLLGTALGMLPGIVLTAVFIDRVEATLRAPGTDSLAWLGIAVAVIVAVALLVKRFLRGKAKNSNAVESAERTHVPHRVA